MISCKVSTSRNYSNQMPLIITRYVVIVVITHLNLTPTLAPSTFLRVVTGTCQLTSYSSYPLIPCLFMYSVGVLCLSLLPQIDQCFTDTARKPQLESLWSRRHTAGKASRTRHHVTSGRARERYLFIALSVVTRRRPKPPTMDTLRLACRGSFKFHRDGWLLFFRRSVDFLHQLPHNFPVK